MKNEQTSRGTGMAAIKVKALTKTFGKTKKVAG